MQIPVEGWYLENRTGTHSKFYTVLIADNGVCVMAWGRIGTVGQKKIQKLPSLEDAKALGLRQVYSKQSGGYSMITSEFRFTIDEALLDECCQRDVSGPLTQQFHDARREPQYEGEKKSVTTHYDDFVDKAQRLLGGASERPFEEVFAEFQELKEAWEAISEKHDEAAITISLTKQMLSQRLMSGAL